MWSLLRAGIFAAAICCLNIWSAAASKTVNLAANEPLSTPSNARATNELPSGCVKTCLEKILPQFSCTIKDSCYCGERQLAAALEKCLSATCELPDYLAGQKSYAGTCDKPVRNKGSSTRSLCWSMFTIATIFIIGRFLGRSPSLGGSGYGWDDWVALMAYILLIPTDATYELEVQNGFGMDMYLLSLDQVVIIMKAFYSGEIFYSVIIAMTKISLVLFYLRIWSADSVPRNFRRTCWALIAALAAFLIAGSLSLVLQCSPISHVWLVVTGAKGSCLNMEALVYAHGALNICFDVVVLLLPVHLLIRMRLPYLKKAGLIATFLVGFLVTICSSIRLQYVNLVASSKNLTWDLHPIGVWSLIEANFSVVVCCMPALTSLLRRTRNKLFGAPHQMGYAMVTGDEMFWERRHRSTQPLTDPEMVLEQWEGDARRNLETEAGGGNVR